MWGSIFSFPLLPEAIYCPVLFDSKFSTAVRAMTYKRCYLSGVGKQFLDKDIAYPLFNRRTSRSEINAKVRYYHSFPATHFKCFSPAASNCQLPNDLKQCQGSKSLPWFLYGIDLRERILWIGRKPFRSSIFAAAEKC